MTRLLLTSAYILVGTGALAWCRHLGLITWPWSSILAPIWLSALALVLGAASIWLLLNVSRLFEWLDRRFPLE